MTQQVGRGAWAGEIFKGLEAKADARPPRNPLGIGATEDRHGFFKQFFANAFVRQGGACGHNKALAKVSGPTGGACPTPR